MRQQSYFSYTVRNLFPLVCVNEFFGNFLVQYYPFDILNPLQRIIKDKRVTIINYVIIHGRSLRIIS